MILITWCIMCGIPTRPTLLELHISRKLKKKQQQQEVDIRKKLGYYKDDKDVNYIKFI